MSHERERCSKAKLDTGVGAFELSPAAAATLGFRATEIHLPSEGRSLQRGGPLPASIHRAVMLRDHCRCRVPGGRPGPRGRRDHADELIDRSGLSAPQAMHAITVLELAGCIRQAQSIFAFDPV